MTGKQHESAAAKLALRLRRLWMGTLYIGVFAVYTLLLGLLVVYYGWRPSLLSLFLIGLMQLFRYVADDVDRIGWFLRRERIAAEREEILQHRLTLQYVLYAVILLLNLAIVLQLYLVSTWRHAIVFSLGLILVETLFGRIRATSRQIEYRSPIYGMRHPGPVTAGSEATRLDEKLATLNRMAERGDISNKAYRKARDRALIKRVMAE